MTVPTSSTVTAPTIPELASAILAGLAEVRCVPLAELEAELDAAGGDLEMDSPEAVAVIAKLETWYGRRLANVEDLEPEEIASVESVAEVIHRHWPADAATGGRVADGSADL
jgi:acyl carrier protein